MSRQAIEEFLEIDFNQVPEEERPNKIVDSVMEFSAKIFSDVPDFSEGEPNESSIDSGGYEEGLLIDLQIQFHKRVCELLFPLRRNSFAVRRELALLMYRMAENDCPLDSMPQQILDLLEVGLEHLVFLLNTDLRARGVEGTNCIDQTAFNKLSTEKKTSIEADLKRYYLTKLAGRSIDISAEGGDKIARIFQQRLLIEASLLARCATHAVEELQLVPVTEEMFFSICKKELNRVMGAEKRQQDLWRQYAQENPPPFSISFLLERWKLQKNSLENIQVKALLENVEFPVNDINVLWTWWLQSQEEKNLDTVPYYLEHGPGHRKIIIARHVSEACFSKLDEEFRSDIVACIEEAFIGEAHYCSKPLSRFLLEDSKKDHFERFFDGLSKSKEIANGWASYFTPQTTALQQAILEELSCRKKSAIQENDAAVRSNRPLRRTGTGISTLKLFLAEFKNREATHFQGSQSDCDGKVDAMEVGVEKGQATITTVASSLADNPAAMFPDVKVGGKRKAVVPADQDEERVAKKQHRESHTLG